ncbi:type II secretion system F family protein [Gimesia panareensis]|uniref:Type II secretion system protein F n=1 Tax=Gimesia panareensis TaxID=2527978 RepID=A0A517PZP5_9PLAN|nr:type II secretion system F family protein [Gimesia panareensis]QDT24827.1 Putative type II secretion system protein F [Gimesia panareensis]QDU47772.1 Putative type II secretion system protein F [Gimesia panareensis]
MNKPSRFQSLDQLWRWGSRPIFHRPRWFLGRVTHSQQMALLRILAVATEKQLSLIDVLEAFEKDIHGRWRFQVSRLIDLLRSGVPLADAIEKVPDLLPSNAFFLIKAGAESGTLPSALSLAAEVCMEQRSERVRTSTGVLLYILAVCLVLFMIMLFIGYWIIPKFKKIFYDFNVELPSLTQRIIEAFDLAANYFWVPIVAIFLLWIAQKILIRIRFLENGWRPAFVYGLIYPRGRAPDVLRFLHVTTESGRPLMGAFETLAHTSSNRLLAERFEAILQDVHKGNDCWTALHDYSLLTPSEVRLLQSAQRAGNLSWALKAIAKSIERRINYRMMLLREYLEPAFIVGLGALVGIIVIGLFLPLVSVISSQA